MKFPFKMKASPFLRDFLGSGAAVLVALPSAIAFGLSVYGPLGEGYASRGALSGIVGTIVIGLVAPLLGGTAKLVSAPCAPAAAVLSVFVLEQVRSGASDPALVPVFVGIAVLFAGLIQVVMGFLGGGKLIKYIPYPVVTGYLSGLGILIVISQLPLLFGIPFQVLFLGSLDPLETNPVSPIIGLVTIVAMIVFGRISKRFPATVLSLLVGIGTYWGLSLFYPGLQSSANNSFIVGTVVPEGQNILTGFGENIFGLVKLRFFELKSIVIPAFTLGFLLSIDTLKTCLVIDLYSKERHDSDRELMGQGIANGMSSLFGGIAGAGTLGPSMVNLTSGGKTKLSGFLVGVFAFIIVFFFAPLLKWIPVATLAGVLSVVGFRMVDWKSVGLLRNSSTVFDFFVIVCVVIAAISTSLLFAAGVGIALAIFLFLRDQIRSSVIKRSYFGDRRFSKKRRLPFELDELEKKGRQNSIFELQGQLFFGTTEQLLNHLEPFLKESKNIILDFKRVVTIDFTAVNLLKQIHSRLASNEGRLILSSVSTSFSTGYNVRNYLGSLGLGDSSSHLELFDSLDEALEFVEEEILQEADLDPNKNLPYLHLNQFQFFEPFPKKLVRKFEKHAREIKCSSGEFLFKKGDISDEMFFIRKGTIRIHLPLEGNRFHHLASFGKGDFFGDMAFLDQDPRSADAVAIEESLLYVISRKKFDKYVKDIPEFGNLYFESLAFTLSKRLRLNHLELTALDEH
ncbi:STAS domain-containing protein [Leptospira idonii]|uniref:STAS domain-containing protein n=2 Tax=Leptospira idonii TaxID=1193500 RepID=A0A4R9M2Y8_9LEPT|nr:STAS domain-containing protein [Leptospira idonii]